MAAVAVVAVGIGGERCRRHYQSCKQAAVNHAKQANLYARQAAIIDRGAKDINRGWKENFSRQKQPAGLIAELLSGRPSAARARRDSVDGLNALRDRLKRWSDYESVLSRNYEWAPYRPWRTITPEPAPPD